MAAHGSTGPTPHGQELVVTRDFDAPRGLVFKAWTDPAHLARWWGPQGYTMPHCTIDLRVGGSFLYCMRSPAGIDIWSTGVYREIVEPERIVYTDSFADEQGNIVPATHYGMSADFPLEMLQTVTFEERDGKTRVTLRHAGIPAGEDREGTYAGWRETFDRLADLLGTEPNLARRVTSKDGTSIAFDRLGTGPAVILVTGATGVRSGMAHLAAVLAPHFTVFNYDRRGRGESGDTVPYAVAREVEDLDALIDEASGSAFVYGISSGAVLALDAASTLPTKVKKLALYEPPFILDDSRPPLPHDYVQQLDAAIAAGRRGDAVEIFMTKALRIPEEYLAPMRNGPMWAAMEAVAHTIAYDGTIMGDTMSGKPLPANAWAAATMPTLVMDGELSEGFFHDAAQALADILLNARRRTLEGQEHGVAPEALAPVLVEFFAG
jgi:uncharacterized protein YndB with AHSA1/START domain/alpha-beta hydrolase superfamily lysophospholipase